MSKQTDKTGTAAPADEKNVSPGSIIPYMIPENDVSEAIDKVNAIIADLSEYIGDALSLRERRGKRSPGVRNYGFMDKVSDIAMANQEFAPTVFNVVEMKELIRQIELLRDLSVALSKFQRIVSDELMMVSDEAFNMALMYYNSVRDLARRRVPGAEAVFRELQLFFRRRRPATDEPTEAEILRDVKATLHGRKDGKIVIENEKPRMVGGKHVVVDETQKPKGAWKATEEGEIN